MKVIKTEKRFCFSCMEEHELKTVLVEATTMIKDVDIDFDAECFYCDRTDELYEDERQIRSNHKKKMDIYQKKIGK